MADNPKLKFNSTNWRDFIPPPDVKRSIELAKSNTYEWAELRCAEPFLQGWKKSWDELYSQPYKGITTDGRVISDVYSLASEGEDYGAPVHGMVEAAESVLTAATPDQRRALLKDVDAQEWRAWMNPEIYVSRHGVRLEEVSDELVAAAHDLIRVSLSPAGYYKASGCMKVNHFLGEVVNGRKVLNKRSYNLTIFAVLSINYLPEKALAKKMEEVAAHWHETYFCWIGGFKREDGFYYKVHSPVLMAEFDHHSGVFLNNALALPFHIHTLVRTPNANDYGKALLRQYLDSGRNGH
ncbi:hypothetical protein LTR10_023360 [Elasticomyces elasticus]|uniref:Uncharacterized protein n=1 Tax=Exophiala sideris TaxID=1016849 RepID=A0ABR0IV82_9EURO|nr:hypothetical protein LTR10_023360 [Elasticomyces elasticus]KAK5023157.1 hypothetical protein LTR13_011301 [Exophiala sideris]KAK5023379.1 hypothetical protein LTS07_009254 [Exophiala sideris]KAK5048741.1 hypothetical protein LTR69_011332 [Exophiala sideris]KAK5176143.1 hypothetical protein LTR44_011322 [Eurotiomycetes sp. CCFEE 6388]